MTSELILCQTFIDHHHRDAARVLEQLPGAQAAALLEAMPAAVAATALGAMVPDMGARCLERLDPASAAAALVELPAPYAAVLLRRLEPASTSSILTAMPEDETRLLSTILSYPPDCAGSMMDSRVFTATERLQVGEALAALRRLSHPHDDVFVVDDEHRLVGIVRIGDLLPARRHEPLTSVMDRAVSRLPATAPRATILNHPGWRRFHTLPVVDGAGLLVGAITHSSVHAMLEEEALGRSTRADAVTTVFALGELYWLGLSGVLDGVASAVRGLAPATARGREASHGRQ